MLTKFNEENLRISVKPRQFLTIPLKYGEYQEKYIEGWKKDELKIGEVMMNEQYTIIPFKRK